MRIILIKDGKVDNLIECESVEKAQELFGSQHVVREAIANEEIDDLYDVATNTLTKTIKKSAQILSKYQFLGRFTTAELAAIYAKADIDPVTKIFIKKLELSEEVQLANPEIAQGLDYLIAQNVLQSARKAQILA